VRLADRLLASLEIRYADELAWAQGYIWVKTDDGRVVKVDPATNTLVADIKVDTTLDANHYCQGLGTDGESLWACSASGDEDARTIDVVRLDPATLGVIATVPVNKVFDQMAMPIVRNRVWVLTEGGTQLVGIDQSTNEPQAGVALEARCFQIAPVGSNLLATCPLDNVMLLINPDTSEVVERMEIQNPRRAVSNDQGVWLARASDVMRLDPQTLIPVVTFAGLPEVGATGDLIVTDNAVWVRVASGFLYRIDPAINTIVEQIALDEALSGGSLLAAEDSLWTTAYDDHLLLRLSAP
jgi:hypothetical protein